MEQGSAVRKEHLDADRRVVDDLGDAPQFLIPVAYFNVAQRVALVEDFLGDTVYLRRVAGGESVFVGGQNNGAGVVVRAIQPAQLFHGGFRFPVPRGHALILIGIGGKKNAVPCVKCHPVKHIYQRGLQKLLRRRLSRRQSHFLVGAVVPHHLVQRRHEAGIVRQFLERYFHHADIHFQFSLDTLAGIAITGFEKRIGPFDGGGGGIGGKNKKRQQHHDGENQDHFCV